jgi:cyclopropane fatty-acyl-phospholipid synthase-like methyltransferase
MVEEAVIRDMQAFDIVLAIGLLHHLDDQQAINLFILAQSALKQGGRLITIDPCYAPDQTAIARFLVRRDRGQNVRTAQQYKHLVETIFSQCKFEVKHRQWIPYTHCIMECKK